MAAALSLSQALRSVTMPYPADLMAGSSPNTFVRPLGSTTVNATDVDDAVELSPEAAAAAARAATGQAAAPPSNVMNSRRLMSSMGTSSPMHYQSRRLARAQSSAASACHYETGKSLGQT